MSTSKYPRGSEWRKWDLHLHAPGTKQNDQFNVTGNDDVWAEYCRRLHDSDVQAFGITDYFSADTLPAFDNRRLKYRKQQRGASRTPAAEVGE